MKDQTVECWGGSSGIYVRECELWGHLALKVLEHRPYKTPTFCSTSTQVDGNSLPNLEVVGSQNSPHPLAPSG